MSQYSILSIKNYVVVWLKKIIYFFLAALGLHCSVQAFSSCGEGGYSLGEYKFLISVAPLVVEHVLEGEVASVAAALGARAQAQELQCRGLTAPRHAESSRVRD